MSAARFAVCIKFVFVDANADATTLQLQPRPYWQFQCLQKFFRYRCNKDGVFGACKGQEEYKRCVEGGDGRAPDLATQLEQIYARDYCVLNRCEFDGDDRLQCLQIFSNQQFPSIRRAPNTADVNTCGERMMTCEQKDPIDSSLSSPTSSSTSSSTSARRIDVDNVCGCLPDYSSCITAVDTSNLYVSVSSSFCSCYFI